jgi:arginine deiminase
MPAVDTPAPPQSATSRFNVTAEANLLQQVIVHTPGHEMELVSPENRVDLLFDDILFLGQARKEHQLMCELFRKIVGRDDAVLQLSELLLDALRDEDARFDFIDQLCRSLPEKNLQAVDGDLKRLSPEELHQFALTGESPLPIQMQPVPNLMFTRDLAAVVHDHVIMSFAATAARTRESILINIVLNHHAAFEAYRDKLVTLPPGVTFEGGDLLVASPNVVLIGHSERTSFGGVMAVAHELFKRTPVEHVLAVDLPKQRASMHLDTVFTFAAPGECVAFPPMLDTPSFGYAVHLQPGPEPGTFFSDMRPNFKQALYDLLDPTLTFIPCGGADLLSQKREQWTDGANLFAPAPGAVIGYERNARTFEQLRDHGYRVVSADSFLSFYENSTFTPGEKVAIQLAGTELSRGRGGPRCMTLPIARHASPDGS